MRQPAMLICEAVAADVKPVFLVFWLPWNSYEDVGSFTSITSLAGTPSIESDYRAQAQLKMNCGDDLGHE